MEIATPFNDAIVYEKSMERTSFYLFSPYMWILCNFIAELGLYRLKPPDAENLPRIEV